MEKLKELLADGFLAGWGTLSLYLFIRMALNYAGIAGFEHNPVILGIEIGASIGVIVLGIERFIKDIK